MATMIERLRRVSDECEAADVRDLVLAMREPTPEIIEAMLAVPARTLSRDPVEHARATYAAVIRAILGPDEADTDKGNGHER